MPDPNKTTFCDCERGHNGFGMAGRECDCQEDGVQQTTAVEWGSFSIRQDGMTVASGSGPYEDVQREAAHYAAVYRQDGPVKVVVRKLKPRMMVLSDD